jgi:2'-5' RNA ligase
MVKEMHGCNGVGTPVNSFALIFYLPEPLAGFLDSLRCELVPKCQARSHVTVLPPRPMASGPADQAWRGLNESLDDFSPFLVELDGIQVFEGTNVIYLAVGAGFRELERMHVALNRGQLKFAEPYVYHPHVTLAQELTGDQVVETVALAQQRWEEFTGPRSFVVDHLTFVQNTLENRWMDLAGKDLAVRVAG